MTLQRPDDMPVVKWLLGDIRPKHLVMAAALFAGAYYSTNGRVSSLGQTQAEQGRQIEQINAAMTQKVDKELYTVQQQELHIQLNRIGDTVDRIEQNLTDHPRTR